MAFPLLLHMDAGGRSSDGDTLHRPVFYGRTGAVPASAVWIGPNRQQYSTGSLQDEDQFPLVEVPQKSQYPVHSALLSNDFSDK